MKMVTAEPQLHLRWHSHSTTFTTMLAELHDRSAFSDLCIVCDDGHVKAHKAVLSLCSPYLAKLLSDKTCEGVQGASSHPVCTTLILPEIPVRDVVYLVSFIYCGQVDVPQPHIASFLNTGKHLHVLGLEQGDRLVESPEPSDEAGSWCGGDVASEDDTVTSSSLPLSRSSTPHSGLSSAPPNDAGSQAPQQQQQQQQLLLTQDGQQQFMLQQQQQQAGTQMLRLTPQAQLKRDQQPQQSSNTGAQKYANQSENSGGRLSDVNANLTPSKAKETGVGRKGAAGHSGVLANGVTLKQEATDDERECPLNPHVSIKEERPSERDEDEEKHMLDLKHSVFSSVETSSSSLNSSPSYLPQNLNPAAASLPSSSSSSSAESAAAAAVALASIASMGNEASLLNGSTDANYGAGDGAIAPGNLGGIIGSDGRIDLNFYLQQAIQYASMPCPLCKKEFKSQSGLRDHIRLHTGERPFICDFCHMNFARASHLKRHRRMHTGEKPFDCRVCGKDFSRGDKLKDHLKRHEADEKLNKIRKQLLNPEDCANTTAADIGSSGASEDSSSAGVASGKQLVSNGDLSTANQVASSASMVVKLASTAAAAASTASSAAGAVGDSLNNLGERVANLTARANPQAVTPDSVMSAKTSVTVAAAIQQQRLQQIQQQTLLQQQIIRRPASAVALTLQPSKKRKLTSSSSTPSNLNMLTSSASHPLFTSSSFSDLVNVASAINSSSIVSQMTSNSSAPSSPNTTLLNLMTSNANNTVMFPSPGTSVAATSDLSNGGSNGSAGVTSSNVIPQMLAMANIGECVLKPIN